MLAQVIALGIILFVALVLALLGLTIKSEKDKIKKSWSWPKFRR